jgi:hypothetical protein
VATTNLSPQTQRVDPFANMRYSVIVASAGAVSMLQGERP